jgi:hypothetical protein
VYACATPRLGLQVPLDALGKRVHGPSSLYNRRDVTTTSLVVGRSCLSHLLKPARLMKDQNLNHLFCFSKVRTAHEDQRFTLRHRVMGQ